MNYKRIEKLAKLYFKTWYLNIEEPKDQLLDVLAVIKERLEDNTDVFVKDIDFPGINVNNIQVLDVKTFKNLYPNAWITTRFKYKNLPYTKMIILEKNGFFTSIYNVTGDAWTETHSSLEEAIKELNGGSEDD